MLEARAVLRANPIERHMVPLNYWNCHLTMSVVKGRGARNALPETS